MRSDYTSASSGTGSGRHCMSANTAEIRMATDMRKSDCRDFRGEGDAFPSSSCW